MQSSELPEGIVRSILEHLFKHDVLEQYHITGTLAIACGSGPLRKCYDYSDGEEDGQAAANAGRGCSQD